MKDKIVLITGATRGLGVTMAQKFAKAGAKVAMNYANSDEHARAALAKVREFGEADIFSNEGVLQLAAAVEEKWGHIDTMVLNASPAL
jgi:3-oxoacyl-[acyl-carrier protein] reductase